jgi:quinoprotein glucose dehydrogenase
MAGHRNVYAYARLPIRLYPGINTQHSLVSKYFMRPTARDRYIRHDLRIWESTMGAQPRLREDSGRPLLGDDLLADWRARTQHGTVRLRAYYDVLPGRDSTVALDPDRRTPWGDPLPRLVFQDDDVSATLRASTEETIHGVFDSMVRAGNGKVISRGNSDFQDHPAGGCRMGSDPSTGVCDTFGRTFDHENLFVVGAPTSVTAGCANGTLTFSALSLRAAEKIGEPYPARRNG